MEDNVDQEEDLETRYQISIPPSVPKIVQTLQISFIDYLNITNLVLNFNEHQHRHRFSGTLTKSRSFLKKLFPRQEIGMLNRLWSALALADYFIYLYLLMFIPFRLKEPLDTSYELFYHPFCTDIDILKRQTFPDKSFIMGRLCIAKAMIQRILIRGARMKMCDIAKLSRIQRYKRRQSISTTIRAIKWWLTPEAEETFEESLGTAALYLEPLEFTLNHFVFASIHFMDFWWLVVYSIRCRDLRLKLQVLAPGSDSEIEAVTGFRDIYCGICCVSILSNTEGVIPFTFYNVLSEKCARNSFEITQSAIDKIMMCVAKLSEHAMVILSMQTSLGFDRTHLTSHKMLVHAYLMTLFKLVECMGFGNKKHTHQMGSYLAEEYENGSSQLDHNSIQVHEKMQPYFSLFEEASGMYNIQPFNANLLHETIEKQDSDQNQSIKDWNWNVHFMHRTELRNCTWLETRDKDRVWKSITPWYFEDEKSQNDNPDPTTLSSSPETAPNQDQPTQQRKKALKKKRQKATKRESAKESASDSDDATVESDDNCEGPPDTTDGIACVYFRHQVRAFFLGSLEDLYKVSLEDMEVLKHTKRQRGSHLNQLLGDEPLTPETCSTATESGSDITDLWEDKHKLLFVDREEDIL